MRARDPSVCVATSTLEVGIDIGDIDSVVLLSPPRTVSSYLQRIGRGNRKSDTCRVLGIYGSESERVLFEILNGMARDGRLDESHEYERPSVVFQQVLSVAWAMMRQGSGASREDLVRLLPQGLLEVVVEDMLQGGHLRAVGDRLIPCDALVDLGDARLIHTVIAGPVGTAIIDPRSGEQVASMHSRPESAAFFLGGRLRRMSSTDGNRAYLEPLSAGGAHSIGRIPSYDRRSHGLSRAVAWELASRSGETPNNWFRSDDRLVCWGGNQYCRLLAVLLELQGICSGLAADDFSVAGLPESVDIDPRRIADFAEDPSALSRIPPERISSFREPTRYFRHLSSKLRAEECRRALPLKGFVSWLRESVISTG